MRVINFLQVIGSSIPVNEGKNVSSHRNLVIEKSSAKSCTEQFSNMEPHFDLDEFLELNNEEQSKGSGHIMTQSRNCQESVNLSSQLPLMKRVQG